MKIIKVFYLKISVFGGEFFYVFEWACFRNVLDVFVMVFFPTPTIMLSLK